MVKLYNWILEEILYLLALALPASIESFSDGMNIKLGNVFIGRASSNNIALMLSALFIGQTVNSLIAYTVAEGFGAYVNILCSQAYGAKQYKLVGLYFYRALFMAALTCFPVFTVFISVRPIVYFLFQDWELAQYTGSYTYVLCFGYPAYLYYKIGIRFLQSLNIVWGPALYLIIGNILNGVIQYILIFRYNTNIEGAAAGYVISNYLIALLVFTHIQLSHVHTAIAHKWTIEYITNWLHTAKYAIIPLSQMLMLVIPSTVYPILFIGILAHDKRQLAIYSIVFSIWWVFTLAAIGFSSAITVRVGHLLGTNEPRKAKRSAIVVIIFVELLLGLFSILLFAISEPLSHLFTTDNTFAAGLAWNFRILSFLLNTDIELIIQGVMNGCCKQGIQMTLRFVFHLLLGSILTMVLVYFVSWKAIAICVIYSIANICVTLIAVFILSYSKWEEIALYVGRNTNSNSEEQCELNQEVPMIDACYTIPTFKTCVLVRYLVCIATAIIIFTVIFVQSIAL